VTARDDVLARVRSALRQAPSGGGAEAGADLGFDPHDPADTEVSGPPAEPAVDSTDEGPESPDSSDSPDHGRGGGSTSADVVGLFVERVEDYRAVVVRCDPSGVADAVRAGLGSATRVVVPPGLPDDVSAGLDRVETVPDDPVLTAVELDGVDAVVTTAALGIAVTGTIVLDHGPGQGRRALSLVPDVHVCVVRADQVVPDVPDAVRALDPRRALTWISGPSATSDIELDRVEGVHGPRTLHVVVVDPS
jgi:L-lactate dehydrogenase complex protein LldG